MATVPSSVLQPTHLDDEHVRERVDLGALARVFVNVADARKRVCASDVHRTRTADAYRQPS